jgi:hypothetical protein
MRTSKTICLTIAGCLTLAAPASSLPLESFRCVTENRSSDCGIAEGQLFGEVLDAGSGEALLTLLNSGPEAAVIAAIYIESSVVIRITGDGFTSEGAPPLLPGAGGSFDVAAMVAAQPPPPVTGIGAGETGMFVLSLAEGASFDDLMGDLRVGVHVIAFASGGSEGLVSQPVPEPTTVAMGLLGLAAAMLGRRLRPRLSQGRAPRPPVTDPPGPTGP